MKKDLLIFQLDYGDATTNYLNAIKRTGLTIDVIDTPYVNMKDVKREYKAAMVLKPEGNSKQLINHYEMLIGMLGDFNIEPNGIQYPVINAILEEVENIEHNRTVLITGRSEELGLPLANELIRRDHIVTVVNSKNNDHPVRYDVVINTAPIKSICTYREGIGEPSATLIDVAGTVKVTDTNKIIDKIGRKTTKHLVDMVMKR